MSGRARAVAYLESVSGIPGLAVADALAAELGDDPVGLRLARRFLEQHRVGAGAYLREVRRRQVAGVSLSGPVRLAFGRLSQRAMRVARLLSCLAAEPVRLDWVLAETEARGDLSTALADLLKSPADAVGELRRYGLVDVSMDGERVRMRAAVQDAVRSIGTRQRGKWSAALFLMEALGDPRDPASWPVYEHLAEHAQRFTEHARGTKRLRSIRGAVLTRLGEHAAARGRNDHAVLLFRAALDHAPKGKPRADLNFQLGIALTGADAVQHLEQAVDLTVRAYGATHPAVARALHSLSHARQRVGDLPGARRDLERALSEGEARLGAGHPDLAVGRTTLGALLREEGDLDGSRAMLEEALGVLVAVAGDDDARVTACRSGLAATYVELGEFAAARHQLERAVDSGTRIVGADHPHVRDDRKKLTEVLHRLGEEVPEEVPPPPPEPPKGHLLEASGFGLDRASWHWRLTDPDGAVLAEHAVSLDSAAAEYRAFTDVADWLRWRPAPDRLRSDEARLVKELGEWIGRAVLGPVAMALATLPVTVRVLVPPEASWLAECPLELAVPEGGDEPLALSPVRLVFDVPGTAEVAKAPVDGRLRVLAVFSAPSGGTALNLRRERRALERLASADPDAVDLRVVQYGSSPEQLAAVLAEPGGWDVVHLAGHGGPGELLLETAAGDPYPIPPGELVALLRPVRRRVRLLVASWCSSAADTELLDLVPADDLLAEPDSPVATGLAPRLAEILGCAVLAMRHPIGDHFAVNLAEALYTSLFAPVAGPWPDVVAEAVTHALRTTSPLRPLWLASPVLFATSTSAGLETTGTRPPATAVAHSDGPSPNEVFVGRVATLARARASGAAVLFTGMPGIGKTACAAEMAYALGGEYRRVTWCDADRIEHAVVGDRDFLVVDGLDPEWDERQCALVADLAARVADQAGKLITTSRGRPARQLPGVVVETLHPLDTLTATQLLAAHGTTGIDTRRLLAAEGGVPGLLTGHTAREEITDWATQRIEWTTPEQRMFLAFLSALDDADRDSGTAIEMLWDPVRRELTGDEPEAVAAPLVAELAQLGLVVAVPSPLGDDSGWGAPMCPAVLAAARRVGDEQIEQYVLTWADEYWTFILKSTLDRKQGELSRAVVHAARRLLAYRTRVGDWHGVRVFLGVIWQREAAPELIETVGAALRAAGSRPGTDQAALVALRTELEARAGEPATEADLTAEVDDAEARGDYARAVDAAMRLVNLLVLAGRAHQALPLADRLPELGRRAGSSPVDMLILRGQRPQVLVNAGRFEEGLDEAERLLRRAGKDRAHWHIREVLHNIAFRAELKLERFANALRHSEAVITSMAERGGSDVELARELLNSALAHRDAGNLGLSRVVIHRAQEMFKAAEDVEGLVAVRGALAELEAREGRPDEAVALSRDVLRLRYTTGPVGDPGVVRDAHNNVAANLSRADGDQTEGVAHLLAACIIDDLTGSWRYAETVMRLQLFAANSWEKGPGSLTELAGQLAVTPDVRFLAYVTTLPGGRAAAEASLEYLRPAVRYAAQSLMMQIAVAAGEKVGVMDEAGNVRVVGEDDLGESAVVVRRRFLRRRR